MYCCTHSSLGINRKTCSATVVIYFVLLRWIFLAKYSLNHFKNCECIFHLRYNIPFVRLDMFYMQIEIRQLSEVWIRLAHIAPILLTQTENSCFFCFIICIYVFNIFWHQFLTFVSCCLTVRAENQLPDVSLLPSLPCLSIFRGNTEEFPTRDGTRLCLCFIPPWT